MLFGIGLLAKAPPVTLTRRAYRDDLQALRGWSVLLVLLFHVGLHRVRGGYLGVDIFFALSGYLITGLLVRSIDAGAFRAVDFYARRAKRLLPAAYVTLAVTMIGAPWLLAGRVAVDVRASTAASLGFVSNLRFWQEHGYFSVDSQLKPVLHFWSLSVEEQFYLLFPALLLIGRQRRVPWMLGLLVSSLAWVASDPFGSAQFFLLPGRVWQFTAGGLCAALPTRLTLRGEWRLVLRIAGIVLLVTTPTLLQPHLPPLVLQLLAVSAALLIMIAPTEHALPAVVTPLRWLGDRSYSVYLMHWPLIAFANNAWTVGGVQDQPLGVKVVLVAVSVLLGALLHRLIERPLHQASVRRPRSVFAIAVLGAVCLLGLGRLAELLGPDQDALAKRLRFVSGLDTSCAGMRSYRVSPACETSSDPTLLVWGDSHAMQLIPALLAANASTKLRQATHSQCAPMLGQAPFDPLEGLDRQWAADCIRFNDDVLAMIAQTRSLEVVILASPLWREVAPTKTLLVRRMDGILHEEHGSVDAAVAATERTVRALRLLGKKVVVVGSPPADGRDLGRCVARHLVGAPVLDDVHGCDVDRERWQRQAAGRLRWMDAVEQRQIAPIVRISDALCERVRCRATSDSVILYQDDTHLSTEGARWLGAHTDLVTRLLADAR